MTRDDLHEQLLSAATAVLTGEPPSTEDLAKLADAIAAHQPQQTHPAFTALSNGVVNERVPFRLLVTPCCGSMLCWVNPRLPSHCPECGKSIYPDIRGCVTFNADATLRFNS